MVKTVVCEQFGNDSLQLVERDSEEIGPDLVRVRVHSVSLNYRDILMVGGQYNPRLPLPLIPCSDGAGVVLETGAEVESLKPGDRVCSTMIPDWEEGKPPRRAHRTTLGGPLDGLLCEERVLPAKALLPIPDDVGFEEAACLPVAGLTAWNALAAGGVGKGSRVLLLGTGGVSIMALGIASSMGARVVITSSSDRKLVRARELGAHDTLNYRQYPEWARKLLEFLPEGVDCVLEVGGEGTFDQSVKATRPGGCVALIGVLAAEKKPVNLTPVFMKAIKVQGILVGSRASFREYLRFLGKTRVKPVIDRVFQGLDQAGAAFRWMAEARHFGKIVIQIHS